MKRLIISGTVLSCLAVTACGGGEVYVMVEAEVSDPETSELVVRPLEEIEIQLIPFDRDLLFDSLASTAPSPEPQLPPDVQIKRDSMIQAQAEWRTAEGEWIALRARLQEINTDLAQYSQAEPQYRVLFNEYNEIEGDYLDAESRTEDSFELFDRLQQETFSQIEEFRAVLAGWEEEAFAGYGDALAARLATRGEILVDTTDATGLVSFEPSAGEWWIYGRTPLVTDELYWNEPIVVENGVPVEVTLTRANADVREIY